MTGKKRMWLLSSVLAVALVSTSYGDVMVGNFEGNLGGWRAADAKLSFSATGATAVGIPVSHLHISHFVWRQKALLEV
jgi:hypothetical protein